MKSLGNSAARVTVLENSVVKQATGAEAAKLRVSCQKQRSFVFPGIQTPRVLLVEEGELSFAFTMERVHDWHPRHWARALESLLEWIRASYQASQPRYFEAEHFYSRFRDVVMTTRVRRYLDEAFCHGATLYAGGPTHGDLTLCNVLATTDTIYLTDFHVASIDVPLFELVKLRQDTRHHWVRMIDSEAVDAGALAALDERVRVFLGNLPDLEWYEPLSVLNLVRKQSLAASPRIASLVEKEIEACLP